jgi:ADP-ribosylglycohydrolase
VGDDLRGRVRGCLLAGAVGDALGAPVEFAGLDEIRGRFGNEGLREPAAAFGRVGAITDDTQLTLFTAEGLVLAAAEGRLAERSAVVRSVHRAYLRWLRTQGERSSHPTFERTAEGWLTGVPELHSRRAPCVTCIRALAGDRMGRPEHPLNTSKGCGSVMRIAPVGLALAADDPFGLGCDLGALTHGHATGYLAAGFFAHAIREIVTGASIEAACAEAREELCRRPHQEECADAVDRALSLARRGSPSPEAVETLGQGWTAEGAVAIALYCALVAPDLERALRLAVNHGGDSHSTGSLTGNLLGAAYGELSIPARWLDVLELRAEIERAADELFEALTGPFRATRSGTCRTMGP